MARTKKQEIQARYNEREEQLKQEYLAETGLKIARGFKQTEGYKKNQRNKRQALYRYEKERQSRAVKGLVTTVGQQLRRTDKGVEDVEFKGNAPGIGNFTADIFIANELFFSAMDVEGDVFLAVHNMQEADAAGLESYGVVRDFDGKITVYTDDFQFEKALFALMRQGEQKQQSEIEINGKTVKNRADKKTATIYYPMISHVSVQVGNKNYEVVTGTFDEADFAAAAAQSIELDL